MRDDDLNGDELNAERTAHGSPRLKMKIRSVRVEMEIRAVRLKMKIRSVPL